MSTDSQSSELKLALMTNWYATRIHIVGAEMGRGSMSRFSSLCGAAYGELLTADAERRSGHGWPAKVYSKLPVCRFCVRAWVKATGSEPDVAGLIPADPPEAHTAAPRKVASRPWRIEALNSARGKWSARTTVTTRARAEAELAYYRTVIRDRPVRARNSQTGEVVE